MDHPCLFDIKSYLSNKSLCNFVQCSTSILCHSSSKHELLLRKCDLWNKKPREANNLAKLFDIILNQNDDCLTTFMFLINNLRFTLHDFQVHTNHLLRNAVANNRMEIV